MQSGPSQRSTDSDDPDCVFQLDMITIGCQTIEESRPSNSSSAVIMLLISHISAMHTAIHCTSHDKSWEEGRIKNRTLRNTRIRESKRRKWISHTSDLGMVREIGLKPSNSGRRKAKLGQFGQTNVMVNCTKSLGNIKKHNTNILQWWLMLCRVWVTQVWSLSSSKLYLGSFTVEMSSLFCLLALRRACTASGKCTSCTCTLLMLGCHSRQWDHPSQRPFSPALLLWSPSTQTMHSSMHCCSDCTCPLSVSLHHKQGTPLQDCLV